MAKLQRGSRITINLIGFNYRSQNVEMSIVSFYNPVCNATIDVINFNNPIGKPTIGIAVSTMWRLFALGIEADTPQPQSMRQSARSSSG